MTTTTIKGRGNNNNNSSKGQNNNRPLARAHHSLEGPVHTPDSSFWGQPEAHCNIAMASHNSRAATTIPLGPSTQPHQCQGHSGTLYPKVLSICHSEKCMDAVKNNSKSIKNCCFLICVNNTAVQYSCGHVACMTIIAEGLNIKNNSGQGQMYVTSFVISFACSGPWHIDFERHVWGLLAWLLPMMSCFLLYHYVKAKHHLILILGYFRTVFHISTVY